MRTTDHGRGPWGFAAFCFLVAVLTEPAGGPAAFGAATLGALGVQLLVRRIQAGGGRRTSPVPAAPAADPVLSGGS
ncbi:hypothetical protein ABIA32_000522 [Streptacidiphilus sp. MAP12-20]|uniref:hypothetical protein n=1 Tax=Streptacidiphilus sp. MAP12-20 TaxID=3156299 RepID=UPI00351377A8